MIVSLKLTTHMTCRFVNKDDPHKKKQKTNSRLATQTQNKEQIEQMPSEMSTSVLYSCLLRTMSTWKRFAFPS